MCTSAHSTDSDVKVVVLTLPEINEEDNENELDINWDRINLVVDVYTISFVEPKKDLLTENNL